MIYLLVGFTGIYAHLGLLSDRLLLLLNRLGFPRATRKDGGEAVTDCVTCVISWIAEQ